MLTTRLVLALLVAAVVAAQDVQDHSELNIANDVFDSDIDAEKSEGPPPDIAARAAARLARLPTRRSTRSPTRLSTQTPPPPPSQLKETAKKLVGRTVKMEMEGGYPCWTIYEGCGFQRCLWPQDMPPQKVWCDALKGDTSKIDVHKATDLCAGWTKSQACDKINQIDSVDKVDKVCTGSKSCGGNGCWDKKTVGKVCCPCSADARNGLSPKAYVEGKLKELMGVAMNRKGIEDLDVGASTKNINYMLKIEAATNAMTTCQEKKCAASGGSLNALSLNMTGGVAESDAALHDLLLDEDAEDAFGGGAAC